VNRIIEGTTTDNGKPITGTTLEKMVEALIGTGIVIGHLDVCPNKGDTDIEPALRAAEDRLSLFELGDTLDETLQLMCAGGEEVVNINAERDTLMLGPTVADDGTVTAGRFEKEMVRIFTENPELLLEPEVVVVDTHGSGHTSMFHRADAAGVPVTWSFAEVPCVYRPTAELARKIAVGKELSRAFLIECFVDEAIRNVLCDGVTAGEFSDDQNVVRYVRGRAKVFDEGDARKVFNAMKQTGIRGAINSFLRSPGHVANTINQVLAKKGFAPLARNIDELRADVAHRDEEFRQKKAQVQAESDARTAAKKRHLNQL
jgi:hypothetical protein